MSIPYASANSNLAARAAIEAMREPTEAMIETIRHCPTTMPVSEIYRRIIDAALSEKP